MTLCEQFTEALAGDDALLDLLQRHAADCAECKKLRAIHDQLAAIPTVHVEPSAELSAVLASDHARTPSLPRVRRAGIALMTALGMALLILLAKPRGDLSTQVPVVFWSGALAWALATFVGLRLLVARGRFGLGVALPWQWLYVAVAATCFEIVAWTANPAHAYSIAHVGWKTWIAHWLCAPIGLAVAALVGVFAFAASRRAAVVSPRSAGVVAGVAAGFGGVLALHMFCGFPDPLHLGVVHGLPVVIAALVGAALGRRFLSP